MRAWQSARCGVFAAVWLAAASASGCAVEVDSSTEDICDQVAEHVAECVGTASPTPEDCDRGAADELLELPCGSIEEGKADFLADVLCAVGLLRHCPTPACIEALPDAHDFSSDDCASLIELEGCAACDYYRCREAQSVGACDTDGYYIGFGYKYCVRYAEMTEPRMSTEGQAWSASSRRCLLESLEANVEDTDDCEALIDAGYDTHAACYRETDFCDLSLSDVHRVVSTIDIDDADLSQALAVSLECIDL